MVARTSELEEQRGFLALLRKVKRSYEWMLDEPGLALTAGEALRHLVQLERVVVDIFERMKVAT